MASFNYTGTTSDGKVERGTKESISKIALTNELMRQGIFVSDISEVSIKKGQFDTFRNLFASKKNLADTFFQLSLLLRSGITLVDAINIIAKSEKNEGLREALQDSASKVSEGMRFSESLARYPNIFDPMYVNLIKASENIGRLSAVLGDIAEYEEYKQKNNDKVSSALVYPMTILVMGMGVLGFLLSVVVPKMEKIFSSMKQEVPGTTKFLLTISDFVVNYGIILLVFLLFVIFVTRYNFRNNVKFRLKVDKRLYNIKLVSTTLVAKFAHILAFQLREGLPLTDALAHAGSTLNNRYIQSVINDVRTSVQSGVKFSKAIKNAEVFPELFPAAVSTGESSGNMPDLLDRVNEFYSKQVDKFLTRFVSLIEPLFIVFIGGMVGFIIVSIMQPLFQMNSMVG